MAADTFHCLTEDTGLTVASTGNIKSLGDLKLASEIGLYKKQRLEHMEPAKRRGRNADRGSGTNERIQILWRALDFTIISWAVKANWSAYTHILLRPLSVLSTN